jgi:ABC-2 type transport system permease protein
MATTVGTGTLVPFMLRRDRIKLPAWVGGLGLFVVYIGAALPQLAATEDDLGAAVPLLQQPVGRMFAGPGYGLDAPTYERFFAGGYLLYLLLLAALMNIMLVTRHTRVEEQSGRGELVRANVTGRHAPLTAAWLTAATTNLLAVLVVAGLAVANGFATTGSLLIGASVGSVGMAFAGITAIAVQLSEYSRGAAGLAGIVLGAAFVLRAVGDMASVGGSALSWASPLGWGSQTAPYVLDRWWPLLLLLTTAAATIAIAYLLQARRDLGASLLASRPGRPEALPSLGSPWGLATRLQRGPALAWGTGIVAIGVVNGLFTQVMLDSAADLPAAMEEILGAAGLLDGYIVFLATFGGYLTAAYVVYAVQSLRAEEGHGRAEAVLATPTSRSAWAGSHLGVIALTAIVIMFITGALTGMAGAAVTGDWSLVWTSVLAHLNLAPAVLLVLGACAVLFGWIPSLSGPVGWAVVAVMVFVGNFAPLLDAPQWVVDLSPLSHPAQVPVGDVQATPLLVLTALTIGSVAVGLLGLRQRQVAGRS